MKEDLKNIKFVRFGGLSSVPQKGYGKSNTFHSPPARRGIYAFPYPFVEYFLLGGDYANPKNPLYKNSSNRIKYLRDKDGNVITNKHPDYDKLAGIDKNWSIRIDRINKSKIDDEDEYESKFDDQTHALYRNFSRKVFQYKGNLWHHLEGFCKPNEILKINKSWILTDYGSYTKALSKFINKRQFEEGYYIGYSSEKKVNFEKSPIVKRTLNNLAKDELEIFIEKV